MGITEIIGDVNQARQIVEALQLPASESTLWRWVETLKPFTGGTMYTERRLGQDRLVTRINGGIADLQRFGRTEDPSCVYSQIAVDSNGITKVFKPTFGARMLAHTV